ncbi:putative PAS/PAC sensor protein [Rippkaea orientalis PCC 8801]|uniref:Putative PAS/PAC sensor protein n=1 Tax=Rippkaea orientalis (strain PCC 8801 / RF-1) TaxID=41431 RepID=B7K0U0_RIPO1|nr:SpoIIE family protein phosphatase [Rippkaea orientalis]ACK65081.1 putative PAS/PAC sensor protein [Rippkaea orientalis PCC 8801]
MKISRLVKQTLIFAALVFAVIGISLSIFSVWNLSQNLLYEYENKGSAMTRTIAGFTSEIIFDENHETIQALVDSFVDIEGLAYILVQDQTGAIIAHTFSPGIPKFFQDHEKYKLNQINQKNYRFTQQTKIEKLTIPEIGPIIDVELPILGLAGGDIHLGLSRHIINQKIWLATIEQVIIITILFILTAIAAYMVVKQISQDLNKLIKGVNRVQLGDYGVTISVNDTNEIGLLANAFNSMVAEIRHYAQHLNKSVQELSDIKYALDQSAIIAITNVHGTIIKTNDRMSEISGYSEQELLGNNHRMLKSGYHPPEFFADLWSTITRGEIWQGEIKNKAKDGRYYWVDTTIVPFKNEMREIFQFLSLQNEITTRKEFEESLEENVRKRTEQLAQANEEITMLNVQLKTENFRMGAELNLLRQMQQLILPKAEEISVIEELDIAGFMEPASEVGGDYYDVLYTDGVVTLGIGDVAGHGLESGILMVMIQTAVRTLTEIKEADPVKFLSTLNRTIYNNIQRMNSDKNLSLAVLNYTAGQLRITGQHEETLIVRSDGKIERINTMDLGFPIGLDHDITQFIDQVLIELNPGDGVVLYTDGITEAKDINKNQYGLERLCRIISENWNKSAQQIEEAVIDDLLNHIGQQKVFDDLTLVVVKQKKILDDAEWIIDN